MIQPAEPLPTLPCVPPMPGFYLHYKHDPNSPDWSNYAYEVLGVGHFTETVDDPANAFMVVYRPLYETALVYQLGKLFDLRPLTMFMEAVEKDGYSGPRFTYVTDPDMVERLARQRDRMYGRHDVWSDGENA
jgi:hypothetical protein